MVMMLMQNFWEGSLMYEEYRSFATRVSQLKIWHFWVIGIESNVCRCTFNRYSVITQFVKLAAGEQLCRRCTHRKLQHFKTFKRFSWKITHFELWHCCGKWAMYKTNKIKIIFYYYAKHETLKRQMLHTHTHPHTNQYVDFMI